MDKKITPSKLYSRPATVDAVSGTSFNTKGCTVTMSCLCSCMLYTENYILYTAYTISCTEYYILYTIYTIPCSVYCIHYTIYYTIHCILYNVHDIK